MVNLISSCKDIPTRLITNETRVQLISTAWSTVGAIDEIRQLAEFGRISELSAYNELETYIKLNRKLRNYKSHLKGNIKRLLDAKQAWPLMGFVKWTEWDGGPEGFVVRIISAEPIPLNGHGRVRPIYPIETAAYSQPDVKGIGNICLFCEGMLLPITQFYIELQKFMKFFDDFFGARYEHGLKLAGAWPPKTTDEPNWVESPMSVDVTASINHDQSEK